MPDDQSKHAGARPKRPRKRITGWKKWALRVLLIFLAPALAVGLLEGTLRLFDCGRPTSYWIKSKHSEAYVSNPGFGIRFFGRVLNRPVIPAAIARPKPEKTYRIFGFGGSAALGTPDTAFSFAHILEAMLNDRFAGTRFEVVNTAMTATNSHVAYQIAKDCRGFDGDLYIVYSGNNEVVGPYGPGTVFMGYTPSLWTIRMNASLKATRSGQLLSGAFGGPRGPKKWSGMRMFLDNLVAADDPSLENTYENFRANLRDICREAERAGAKVILSTIITNLKDLPPFASVHRPDLPAGEKKLWDTLYEEGAALQKSGNHAGALERYQAAEKIDDAFAELHFRMGKSLLALKQTNRARARFVRARDLDALRFRADTRINDVIRATAAELGPQGVHLVDAENAVSGQNAPGAIHGAELLYEHVHLRFEGNHALAAAVFRKVVSLLPPSIRKGGAADVDPPSLERSAALVVFTPYTRYRLTKMMSALTGRAPFSEERRAQDEAEVRRLRAHVTRGSLADTARAYRERLEVRPNDFLLRTGFAALEKDRRQYASAVEQYEAALRLIPDDPKAHDNLGSSLQGLGRFEEALGHHEEALRLKPGSADAHNNLGSALVGLKRFEEAVFHYEEALRLKPDLVATHDNLGNVRRAQKRFAEAVEHYEQALRLKPGLPKTHNSLANALVSLGRLKEAAAHYEMALQLKPDYALARRNLANVRRRLGGADETVKRYEEALRLKPDLVKTRNSLALLLQRMGRFKEAIAHFEEVIRQKPDNDSAHNNLGWLRATCPDPQYRDAAKAEASARRACELTGWKHFGALDTLGAACATGGEFDEAVKWQTKAVELAPEGAKADLSSRLELYAAGKPYRMPAPRPESK